MSASTPVVLPSDQSSIPVRVVTSDGTVTADIVTAGTRNAQSIEYPALLDVANKILAELKAIRLHLNEITEETDPL